FASREHGQGAARHLHPADGPLPGKRDLLPVRRETRLNGSERALFGRARRERAGHQRTNQQQGEEGKPQQQNRNAVWRCAAGFGEWPGLHAIQLTDPAARWNTEWRIHVQPFRDATGFLLSYYFKSSAPWNILVRFRLCAGLYY